MNYISYIWLKIYLLFTKVRVKSAKKRMLSGIQSSRHTTGYIDRSYRQFLHLSSKQEQISVALRRIASKNTNRPILRVKIDTGSVSVSWEAQNLLTDFDREMALTCHRNGDWGESTTQNWQYNNEAVRSASGKLISRYPYHNGGFFLIETDLRIPKTYIRLEGERI